MSNSSAWPQASFQAVLREKDCSSCCVIYSCRAEAQDSTGSCFVCSSYSFPNKSITQIVPLALSEVSAFFFKLNWDV